MPDIFEQKSGRFIPMSKEETDKLTDEQLAAYVAVSDAADEMTAANIAAEAATNSLHASAEGLRLSQEADRLKPKWTRLDEVRAMIDANKKARGIV